MKIVPLLVEERLRLADALEALTEDEWRGPSLCEGWSARVVAAHLNATWAAKPPFLVKTYVSARGNVAETLNQLSLRLGDRLDPAASIAGLRANSRRHVPPPFPIRAPLTDVIVHGADILTPLGRSVDVAPEALEVVLTWLAHGAMRAFLPKSRVAGLSFSATDIDLRLGDGALIEGPALALCGAVLGRPAYLPQLSGPGVERLAGRL